MLSEYDSPLSLIFSTHGTTTAPNQEIKEKVEGPRPV